jgi:ABC-type polysaccharide/polyol phosphate transport system ATPase subunit
VSRHFRLTHERNSTLKETLIRRRRARYTELWALKDVNLDIEPGEAVGIVGRNGSGKSTLLKMLAGILPPQTGVVQAGGKVAAMLELGAGFHPDFTGRENVFMNAAIHGLSEKQVQQRLDRVISFAEIEDFIDMPVRTYSSGMQLRLAFAVAAHVDPDILLLDEVLAVGDEAFQRKCLGRIFDFKRRGGTLVFVSHDPNAVEQICDRAVLIDSGQVVLDGRPSDVIEAYHEVLADAPVRTGARFHSIDASAEAPKPQFALGGWGTGQVEITDVALVGPKGSADRFLSGDDMTVRLRISADSRISSPSIGVGVRTGDGTMCFGTNTRLDGVVTPDIHGVVVCEFRVADLPLHEGVFNVVVAVSSSDDSTVYHWIDHAAEFSVFGRRAGVGIVDADLSWRVMTSLDAATSDQSRAS